MLRQLSIVNFGLIESVEMEFDSGLQVVTGETGVGKSLLLNSLSVLAGKRAKTEWIRRDADEARVVGFFAIEGTPVAASIDELTGLSSSEEGLRVERRLRRTGRHRAFLNGEELPLSMVRRIGSQLIEIHGQRAQLSLLDASAQLEVLDRFAGLIPKREEFTERYRKAMALARELDVAAQDRQQRHDRRMFLTHVLAELDEAELRSGEREEIERELALLEERDRVVHALDAAIEELHDAEPSVIDRIGTHARDLGEIGALHVGLGEFVEAAQGARSLLEDGLRALRQVHEDLDRDPAKLDELRRRLDRLVELEERYRRSGDELVAYHEEVREELEEIVSSEEKLPAGQEELDGFVADLIKRARSLTRRRKAAGKKIAEQIHGALSDLGMERATLEVAVESIPEPEAAGSGEAAGDPPQATRGKAANRVVQIDDPMIDSEGGDPEFTRSGGQLRGFDASGSDRVEFVFGPNPGEPVRPLRAIASGGELSRVMLAIESVLASADRTPILVFDEIDSGVGGRLGTEIGRKLREIGEQHQVFCVTHLPQVACFGEAHYHVDKTVDDGRTRTSIQSLTGKKREAELATMIRGSAKSKTSLAEAREMLQAALQE
ncbi:MAG: DNA repair protein RecN [Planctomycetota bacterium]